MEGSNLMPEVVLDDDEHTGYPTSANDRVDGKSNFPKSWSKGLSGAMARTLDH